jgi:4'-phosphopantetheinyl transferase EntD
MTTGRKKSFSTKKSLYKGAWFIVTTAFTFVDGKLVKQETVKEERLFLGNDCKK